MHKKNTITSFNTRDARSRYVAKNYNDVLHGSVLDIGCDKKNLSKYINATRYVGVDIDGDPDQHIDLDSITKLPFIDNEFDTVVCTDVLEHLDQLHLVFDEIIRVSKKDVIISLPNCWNTARRAIERGHGNISHYGLPITNPTDRHKWFFNHTQAQNFITYSATKHNLYIYTLTTNFKKRNIFLNIIRRLINPSVENYNNRFSHTIWVHYKMSV